MKSQGNSEKKSDCCPHQKQIKNKSSKGIWKFSLTGTRGHAHLFTSSAVTGTQSAWPLLPFKRASVKMPCSYSKRRSWTQSFRTTWILGVAGKKVQFSLPTMDRGTRDYMYAVGCFKYTKILHSETWGKFRAWFTLPLAWRRMISFNWGSEDEQEKVYLVVFTSVNLSLWPSE